MLKNKQASGSLGSVSFTHIETQEGVEEYELKKNGLRVLYSKDTTSPVVGLMVTYLVGSRHEAIGYTGSTHILEHLMFKGSKHFPSKKGLSALDALSKKGALVNASTWLDRTNYYEVLPDEHFEYVVRLEADRMRHALITEKDLQEELPAVKSEYAMSYENNPVEFLDAHMWATAFTAHPYHHTTIGSFSDIEHASVEKLQHFYNTYYHPNNAVVTVVGNVERDYALTLIEKYFGVHPRSKHEIPVVHAKEPEQLGKRFVEIHREGTKNIVAVAYKVPEALHLDTPAILILSSILGDGKTSRLYRELVLKKLASSVWTSYMPFRDPGLFMIYATPLDGVSHEKVQNTILSTCEQVTQREVSKGELARVVARVGSEMAFARDGHYALLSSLNESIATGDWRFFFSLPKTIGEVSSKKVRDVAKKYFTNTALTIGHYRAGKK
jgi:zinc protease